MTEPGRRAAIVVSIGVLVGILAIVGAVSAAMIGERVILARQAAAPTVEEIVARVVAGSERVIQLWSLARTGDQDDQIVDALLRHLPPEGLAARSQEDHAMAGELLSQLLMNERANGATQPSPRIVELTERLIGEPRVRLRQRRHPNDDVRIPTPPYLISNDLRTVQRVESVTVDGQVPHGLEHQVATGGHSMWIRVGHLSGSRSVTLRIEWTVEVYAIAPFAAGGPVQGVPTTPPLATRRIVDERTIEIVAPGEPLILPTRDPAHRPWGDAPLEWHFELRPVGARQLVHLSGWLRDRRACVVCGQWFVEQGDRRVAIGASHSSAGSGDGEVRRLVRSVLLTSPLDPDEPLAIIFEPRPDALPPGVEYDHYWDEPLTIALPLRGPHRRMPGAGWVVWDRLDELLGYGR